MNKEKAYWDDQHIQDLKEGIETFEFTTDVEIPINSTIVLRTPSKELVPFIVQRANKVANYSRTIRYECDAEFLELRYTKVLEPQILEGQTPETALSFGLQGTRWQVGEVGNLKVKSIPIDEYMNVLKYLRLIANEFELELRFRVEFLNSRVSRRYVDFVEKSGLDAGKEILFGKDLQNIERLEDSSGIVTALYGIGPADDNGNYMTVAAANGGKPYIENRAALERWGKDGEHRYDIFMPSVDRENITPQELFALTQAELFRRINSVVQYKVDGVDFYDVFGMEHEAVNLGDTVRIKDQGFTPALYLEARVIRIDRSYTDPSRNQYTLGDYVEVDIKTYKYIRDLQKLINKNKESWNNAEKNAVQRAQLIIEQTEESWNAQVISIQETAEEQATLINQINLDIDGIELSASNMDSRIGSVESLVSIQAGQISSKVSYEDYNGNTINSLINQTATAIEIEAEKIALRGKVTSEDIKIGRWLALDVAEGGMYEGGIMFGEYASGYGYSEIKHVGGQAGNLYMGGALVNLQFQGDSFQFQSGQVDFSRASGITWGTHGPTNAAYATNAGNAQTLNGYTASDFSRSGHSHYGTYVQDRFSQNVGLYRDNSTGRMVITINGSPIGALAWN
ncbi:phage tail spike protein [Bacillus mesophilum]|nr:phage tail spike protein [Bacillus mesophilum]